MKRLLIVAGMASLLLVSGCKEEKEVKTVQWYRDHPQECQARVNICKDNPGQLKDDPNCINALRARAIDSGGKASEAPRLP